MANNALPSPATIEGINKVGRGDGDGKEGGVRGQMDEYRGEAGGEERREATGIHKHRCKALPGDITDPLVAILEGTALVD